MKVTQEIVSAATDFVSAATDFVSADTDTVSADTDTVSADTDTVSADTEIVSADTGVVEEQRRRLNFARDLGTPFLSARTEAVKAVTSVTAVHINLAPNSYGVR
ncbi:MAG: hypothetical protein QOJ98_557 [Acidobacteriota bacterium]|nr:hypothetical protein [Acidobacteriota bacterium]